MCVVDKVDTVFTHRLYSKLLIMRLHLFDCFSLNRLLAYLSDSARSHAKPSLKEEVHTYTYIYIIPTLYMTLFQRLDSSIIYNSSFPIAFQREMN